MNIDTSSGFKYGYIYVYGYISIQIWIRDMDISHIVCLPEFLLQIQIGRGEDQKNIKKI